MGTSGGGTFSRMNSEQESAEVGGGGPTARTAGDPAGLTRVTVFRKQPSVGPRMVPLQERREGSRLRHRCRYLSGCGGGQPLKFP